MLGTDSGGIERSRHSFFRPAPSGIFFDINKINNLAGLEQRHFNKIILNELIPVELGSDLITTGNTDKWYEAYSGKLSDGTIIKNDDGIREKFSIISTKIRDNLTNWSATASGSRLSIRKKNGHATDILTIGTSDTTGAKQLLISDHSSK